MPPSAAAKTVHKIPESSHEAIAPAAISSKKKFRRGKGELDRKQQPLAEQQPPNQQQHQSRGTTLVKPNEEQLRRLQEARAFQDALFLSQQKATVVENPPSPELPETPVPPQKPSAETQPEVLNEGSDNADIVQKNEEIEMQSAPVEIGAQERTLLSVLSAPEFVPVHATSIGDGPFHDTADHAYHEEGEEGGGGGGQGEKEQKVFCDSPRGFQVLARWSWVFHKNISCDTTVVLFMPPPGNHKRVRAREHTNTNTHSQKSRDGRHTVWHTHALTHTHKQTHTQTHIRTLTHTHSNCTCSQALWLKSTGGVCHASLVWRGKLGGGGRYNRLSFPPPPNLFLFLSFFQSFPLLCLSLSSCIIFVLVPLHPPLPVLPLSLMDGWGGGGQDAPPYPPIYSPLFLSCFSSISFSLFLSALRFFFR